ncbi:PaaI family thioesterase [Alistipes sp.]|uniref:PaaI family thioesterase n=1 Tax=Alistipes sp. TaxID=1872444 RepID=UPI003AB43489
MDVTKLPFNEFIGLKLSDEPNYLLMLDDKAEYLNHLNTVHAGALFTLAEATSGHYLLGQFDELPDIVPVVRKVEIKYRKPAIGAVYSNAAFLNTGKSEVLEALAQKGRVLLEVEVSLYDCSGTTVMQAVFEWFVTKR